jgi:hypothetical protein
MPHPPPEPPSFLGLYADDAAAATAAPTALQSASHLTRYLTTLYGWSQRWQMAFNPAKTQLLQCDLLHHATDRRPAQVVFHRTVVTSTPTVKYLGLHLDSRLTFLAHAKAIVRRVTARYQQLQRLYPPSQLALELHVRLYCQVLRPMFAYGCSAYLAGMSPEALRLLEVRERSILRYIVPRRPDQRTHHLVSTADLYRITGVTPLRRFLHSSASSQLRHFRDHPNPLVAAIGTYPEVGYRFRRPGDLTDSSSSSAASSSAGDNT